MPIKKDETGKRWVEMEVLLPGTPEQVWQAMATGPGNTAWFTKSEIEPRVGGALMFDMGDVGVSKGEVTIWEPPHRFGYVEREWAAGAPACATEITITARSGDRCVMRMVHSLFTSSDEWDDQVEGFEGGWPGFFKVLRVYLAHFAGAPAAVFAVMRPVNGDGLSAWQRLSEATGLAGANAGERRSSASGPERWSGVVEHVLQDADQRYVVFRVEEPSPQIALIGTYNKRSTGSNTTSLSVCCYFYGADANTRAAAAETTWRGFIAETFGEK